MRLREKNPSTSFSVTVPVTKSFLLAVKWTYLGHHPLRHQRKLSKETLLESSPMRQVYYTAKQFFISTGNTGLDEKGEGKKNLKF